MEKTPFHRFVSAQSPLLFLLQPGCDKTALFFSLSFFPFLFFYLAWGLEKAGLFSRRGSTTYSSIRKLRAPGEKKDQGDGGGGELSRTTSGKLCLSKCRQTHKWPVSDMKGEEDQSPCVATALSLFLCIVYLVERASMDISRFHYNWNSIDAAISLWSIPIDGFAVTGSELT